MTNAHLRVSRLACIVCSIAVFAALSSVPARSRGQSPTPPSEWRSSNATLTATGDELTVTATGSQPSFDREFSPVEAPAVLEFEMKTTVGKLNHTVRWVAEGAPSWSGYARIPVVADGEWRRYRLPLADRGAVRAARIALNAEAGDTASVRGFAVATAPPLTATQPLSAAAVTDGSLRVRFDPATRVFEIDDTATGRHWKSEPLTEWAHLTGVVAEGESISVSFTSRFSQVPAAIVATVQAGSRLQIELRSDDLDSALEGLEHVPPHFSTDFDSGRIVFCDRSCGVLLDQTDAHYAHWPLRVYGNTHCLNMPWVGVFDEVRDDGVMLHFDTPYDAEMHLDADNQGRHWPQPHWLPSMDRIAYPRSVTLEFVPSGGYVAMAKRYREVARREGRLRTYDEKVAERPKTERMKGAPILWGRGTKEIVQQAQALGVLRGLVNNCNDPLQVAWMQENGYLTGRYDNFCDIFDGETGPRRDNIARTAVRQRPGAGPMDGWLHVSGQRMAWRSSAFWIDAAIDYAVKQLESTGQDARFIDVAAAMDLVEDWDPNHRFDRRQDVKQRRALFEFFRQRGLVLGTEHGNDWAADLVDLYEGALSGPFWWSSWEAGRLVKPTLAQLTPEYLKYGIGYGHRVPLWQLVYGDALVTTWYWGDTNGTLYQAAPELADRKDLLTLLYGGAPLLWMDETCFGWNSNRQRWVRSIHDTCKWHEVVGFAELLSHEFLTPDRAVQRSVFAGDAAVIVNFGDEPREVPGMPGVVLAPRGYLATAPGFRQERLWVDGEARMVTETKDYLVAQNVPLERVGVAGAGRLTAWRAASGAWRFFGEPGQSYQIDGPRLLGVKRSDRVEVLTLSADGVPGEVVAATDADGRINLAATADRWRFELRSPVATQVSPGKVATR
jgi:hypothetical protein